jgi:AraC family transcriptional regulator
LNAICALGQGSFKTIHSSKAKIGDMAAEQLGPGEWYGSVERAARIGGLNFSIIHHPRARRIDVHEHALAYFTLLVAGEYEETHEGTTVRYEPFSLAFHPAKLVHWDQMGDETTLFAIELADEWQARIGMHFNTTAWRLELQYGEAVWLAARLLNQFVDEELDALEADAVVSEMLGIALRLVDRDRPQRGWVNDVKAVLRERFAERLSLESLAERAGIHPASLARGFRLDEGTTIGDYVSRLRVQHACRLINDETISLVEIAAACGFADQSHLTRVFKAVTGLTPGSFRERRILDTHG